MVADFTTSELDGLSNATWFRMTAVYSVPWSGSYVFNLTVQGSATLWLGDDISNPSASLAIVSTVAGSTATWNTSREFELTAGNRHFIEVIGRGSAVSVGALLGRALFNNKDTAFAVDEVQVCNVLALLAPDTIAM